MVKGERRAVVSEQRAIVRPVSRFLLFFKNDTKYTILLTPPTPTPGPRGRLRQYFINYACSAAPRTRERPSTYFERISKTGWRDLGK